MRRSGEWVRVMVRIAVCICTCDRHASLARVLGVLERVDLGDLPPAYVDLIVVDNRPDGRVQALCKQYAALLPIGLVCVEETQPGISFARNRAVAEARARGADLVAFLDDDDLPERDWLRQLLEVRRATNADFVFGFWRLPADLKLPTWLRQTRYFRPPDPQARNRYGLPAWAGTYNLLVSMAALERLSGPDGPFLPEFAHSSGEDSDLFIRAHRAGLSHACALQSIVVRTWEPERLTLRGILRRGFVLGGARVHLARAHQPATQTRRLVWSSWRKLGKSLLQLPLAITSRSRLVDPMLATAQALGEIYAWTGQRYTYYLRRRG